MNLPWALNSGSGKSGAGGGGANDGGKIGTTAADFGAKASEAVADWSGKDADILSVAATSVVAHTECPGPLGAPKPGRPGGNLTNELRLAPCCEVHSGMWADVKCSAARL